MNIKYIYIYIYFHVKLILYKVDNQIIFYLFYSYLWNIFHISHKIFFFIHFFTILFELIIGNPHLHNIWKVKPIIINLFNQI